MTNKNNIQDIPNCDMCPIKKMASGRCLYSHNKFRYGKDGKPLCSYKGEIKDEPRCASCANWQGHRCANGRHEHFGECYYGIGSRNAYEPVGDCRYYIERKDDDMAWGDWIEMRVEELGAAHDSSPESRKARIQARKDWERNHIANS